MAAPIDLTGARLGRLVVSGPGHALSARHEKSWRVRCDCGAEEIYLQRRLTQDTARKPAVRACVHCRAPRCGVCGAPVASASRGRKRTCSDACAVARHREVQRSSYRRRVADPAVRQQRSARVSAARAERLRSDPDYAAAEFARAQQRRAAENADPAVIERRRRRARIAYAARAEETQRRRRERLDTLSAEQLARWLARARAYGAAYRRRWRAQILADPDAHRSYLDLLREYRRRRALRRLLADAATLPRIDP